MRGDQRAHLERILAAAHASHERELPGSAQLAVRRFLAGDRYGDAGGLTELVGFAWQSGYISALADIDALADVVVDVRGLPETDDPS